MENTVGSPMVASPEYQEVSSGESELRFQSRVLKDMTQLAGKQRYRIEYKQTHGAQLGGLFNADLSEHDHQMAGYATITISNTINQGSTAMAPSCDIDEMMTENNEQSSQFVIFSGIVYHMKLLCKAQSISHLTYDKLGAIPALSGYLSVMGFKRCTCDDMTYPSKYCLGVASGQGTAVDLTSDAPGEHGQAVRRKVAKVIHNAISEPTATECWLDPSITAQRREVDDGKKVFCTHWLNTGNCAYMAQGCRFKHELPKYDQTWEKLGFNTRPGWLKSKTTSWIRQHTQKDADVSKDMTVTEPAMRGGWRGDFTHSDVTLRSIEDRQLRDTNIKIERNPSLSPDLHSRRTAEQPFSSDSFGRQGSKRLRQSCSSRNTNKKIKYSPADRTPGGAYAARESPRELFPDHIARKARESNRPRMAVNISDHGYHRKGGSRNYRGEGYEPSYDQATYGSDYRRGAPSEESYRYDQRVVPASYSPGEYQVNRYEPSYTSFSQDSGRWRGMTSEESRGYDQELDPASQFLGSYQVETQDAIYGPYTRGP